MERIKDLICSLSSRMEVEAIALGGSRATGTADASSDYDIYVYLSERITPEERLKLLAPYCSYMEIANRYWEEEDDVVLHCGIKAEFIYRSLTDFSAGLRWTIDGANAFIGYTTCMWHNLLNCLILFDRGGHLTELQKHYTISYPEQLRTHIIQKNRDLLNGRIPSFYDQIEKAVERHDMVSINHRIAAFFASYFDILFAYNRLTHPGEKKLIAFCINKCTCLPEQFEEDITTVLCSSLTNEVKLLCLTQMIQRLDTLLSKN